MTMKTIMNVIFCVLLFYPLYSHSQMDFQKIALTKSKSKISETTINTILTNFNNRDGLHRKDFDEYDFEILSNLLKNKSISLYLADEGRELCLRVKFIRRTENSIYFNTRDDPESKFELSNFSMDYNYIPRLEDAKILNSASYVLDCESVKKSYSTKKMTKSKLNQIVYDTETGLPFFFTLTLSKGYCAKTLFYTDCSSNCHTYKNEGSTTFTFILSKRIADNIVKQVDLCDFCED